ncbi:MAG: amidase [Burkholderiales bacterium]|nr:amidase [Burkholderiales bacterium]
MKDTAFHTTTELLRELQQKHISSVELLDLYIDRFERINPRINAIVATDFDNARKRAHAADQARAAGEIWGPLHGLPMTIKDTLEVAGMPCTAGAPEWKEHVPQRHADVVAALIKAGAIIFGKTNVPLHAMDWQSYNANYGTTNNPWDLARTPGGSSGGAAAALAAGLTSLDIGSDLAGSIRTPAHFCGVYGHKPSLNVVPTRGHIPPRPGIHPGEYSGDAELAVIGPLARSADDLDLALDIIAGPKPHHQTAWSLTFPAPRKKELKDFKVGLWLDDPVCPVDAAVGDCLRKLADALAKAGAQVSDARPAIDFTASHDIYMRLVAASQCAGQPDDRFYYALGRIQDLDRNDRSPMAQWLRGTAISHRDWVRSDYQRLLMRQKWADYFKEFDVLLCPVASVTAFAHDHGEFFGRTLQVNGQKRSYIDTMMAWAGLPNVSFLPVTTAPIGIAHNGLPVGVQIVGPYLEDKTPIHFAKLLAKRIGGFSAPSGY